MNATSSWILPNDGLDGLLQALRAAGHEVIGPTVRDGAIVLDRVGGAGELPQGWGDEQAPGRYRVVPRDDAARFGWAVGPHSMKRFLFPPDVRLWRAAKTDAGFAVEVEPQPTPRYAFVGVRPCELAALAIQDRVFLGDRVPDPVYAARREGAFVVVVHCGQPAGTCFCVSMDTGPRARGDAGYDLALTEVLDGDVPWYLVEAGSDPGRALVAQLGLGAASAEQVAQATQVTDAAAGRMGRTLETERLAEALQARPEDRRWEQVAARCLTCANCTLACPTCFCSDVEDTTDLTGDHAERWRRWDTCFSIDHSHVHGGSVRASPRSRYRQWLTHKLSTWFDQFGTSGCVGCGRCVTWCPVGIDLTEEAGAIRAAHLAAEAARADDS